MDLDAHIERFLDEGARQRRYRARLFLAMHIEQRQGAELDRAEVSIGPLMTIKDCFCNAPLGAGACELCHGLPLEDGEGERDDEES